MRLAWARSQKGAERVPTELLCWAQHQLSSHLFLGAGRAYTVLQLYRSNRTGLAGSLLRAGQMQGKLSCLSVHLALFTLGRAG